MIKYVSVILVIFFGCVTPVEVKTDDVKAYDRGKKHYDATEYSLAIDEFKTLVTDMPWSSKVDNALEYWGKSLLKLNEDKKEITLYDSAIAVFNKIPEKSSGYVEAKYYIGNALYGIYDEDESISRDSLISSLFSVYNTWPANYYAKKSIELIVAVFLEEDESDSAKYYGELVGISVDDSLTVLEKERYQAARSLYIAATKSDNLTDYNKAIDSLKAYVSDASIDSLEDEALFYIGKSYYRSDRYREAISWFTTVRASEDVSEDSKEEALYREGYCYMKSGSSDTAISLLEEYDETYSEGDFIQYSWRYLGELTLSKSDTTKAVDWYGKIISKGEKGSNEEEALYALGVLKYTLNEFDFCITHLSNFLLKYGDASANSRANSHRLLGHSYRKKDSLAESETWFKKGVDEDSFKVTQYYDNLLYWCGSVHYDLNKKSEAKGYLETYLSLYPDGSYKTNAESLLSEINGGA